MGSNWSSLEREPSPDPWWPAAQLHFDTHTTDQVVEKEEAAETAQGVSEERLDRGRVRQEELDAFKEELAQKRALRHEALAALQEELRDLRSRVGQEESLSHDLRLELEKEREENRNLLLKMEKLTEEVEQKVALEKQIQALKDVSEIGKEMLRIRELQVRELKKKLVEINISSVTAPPEDLRIEYEKQIENIRKLRTLYEERAAATSLEHRRELEREEARISVLETKLNELQRETDECREAKKDLESKIEKLESTIQTKEDELESTKDKLFSSTVQNKNLNSQMKLINNLFSQMLVSPKIDLDRLTRLLKENHGLITDLTEKGDSNEVAALLVDLAGQVEKENEDDNKSEQNSSLDTADKSNELIERIEIKKDLIQSEIASNLSKVWRVMIELLSHHQNSGHRELTGGAESCYKCVQTPSGPRSVISVSQTFLTLKDLILEKNRLVKEVGRLKTLNNHLEHRLGSQEKRLLVVTSELRKTWGVVNKLRAQHKQLHTHEKILRYELQQKRCMLNELKQELDHCRDKWEQARQKNSQTEEDWKKLRKEFAARKSRKESNSAESGYEEEDVAHSPPSEQINNGEDLFETNQNEGSETELSEEDIEHSDGNSFDTVIDLLDIACIEHQTEGESEIPFVLCETPSETIELSPSLLPLTGSEFTEGLNQIESEDLAAVLDSQYQNQLLGADYNLSLPSSSGSSPIPTENDDFASSEMDASEEDSYSNDNHIYTTPLPVNQPVSEDTLLFGSNSSQNISKFLEGLFVEQESNSTRSIVSQNLYVNVPSTSQIDENGSTTPIVNNENCYQFPPIGVTSEIINESSSETISQNELPEDGCIKLTPDNVQQWFSDSHPSSSETVQTLCGHSNSGSSLASLPEGTETQEESLKAREERLKKLEQQCRSLVSKVMSTSFRSEILSNKLDELQTCHGSSDDASDSEEESAIKLKENILKSQHKADKQSEKDRLNEAPITLEASTSRGSPDMENGAGCLNKDEKPSQKLVSKCKSPEESLEARAARLKRLEDQCKSLFSKMSATSSRNKFTVNKMDELHVSCDSPESTVFDQPSTSKLDYTLNFTEIGSDGSIIGDLKNKNESKISPLTQEERDVKLPDLVSESTEVLNKCSLPGPSSETNIVSSADLNKNRTPEQILEARAERFKRLEDQCKSLVSKMTATSLRSEIISNKLDELHSCYGSSESTSDNDEHSSSSREDRVRPSPNSSPRHNRRTVCPVERVNETEIPSNQSNTTVNEKGIEERIGSSQTTQPQLETNINSRKTDRTKRTPEEILQARAQRLNNLEEQCKSLFSKMSATSQRSDVISNRLEELHEQYGQPSTSENGVHSGATLEPVTNNATASPDIKPDGGQSSLADSDTCQVEKTSDMPEKFQDEETK